MWSADPRSVHVLNANLSENQEKEFIAKLTCENNLRKFLRRFYT